MNIKNINWSEVGSVLAKPTLIAVASLETKVGVLLASVGAIAVGGSLYVGTQTIIQEQFQPQAPEAIEESNEQEEEVNKPEQNKQPSVITKEQAPWYHGPSDGYPWYNGPSDQFPWYHGPSDQ